MKNRAYRATCLTAIFAVFPLLANAGELVSPAHYGDELDRCINEVRKYLGQSEQAKIRHEVTAIDKHGSWYEFELLSAPYVGDTLSAAALSSRCRANRFNNSTILLPEEPARQPVIAKRD